MPTLFCPECKSKTYYHDDYAKKHDPPKFCVDDGHKLIKISDNNFDYFGTYIDDKIDELSSLVGLAKESANKSLTYSNILEGKFKSLERGLSKVYEEMIENMNKRIKSLEQDKHFLKKEVRELHRGVMRSKIELEKDNESKEESDT